ncbi:MAG: prepilin-type N-terminal cleavage/methylation domain-containing protein [Planctomycetota bacterium]|nr:MAG: prepilin-type N-terminal cleavage/methylation domain-containing protein [Planctomycetota bacterium]
MKRGFTLLEVVAATVLLTMIVAAGIPFLRSARADLQAAASPVVGVDHADVDRAEIETAVDDLLRQRPGLIAECVQQPAGYHVEWTSDEHLFRAEVRLGPAVLVDDEEHRSTHTWAVFNVDGTECLRWMRVPSQLLDGGDSP